MAQRSPAENYRHYRDLLPDEVALMLATKERSPEEVAEVIEAGADLIGENYVQEAEAKRQLVGALAERAQWHMIGHLQRNKVNDALDVFDCIQSLDSMRLARAINRRAARPVRMLVEVNIAQEKTKFGITPDGVVDFVGQVAQMENLRVEGLMTIEPLFDDPADARLYLARMRELFDALRAQDLPGVQMRTLSMGMSGSWQVAVEEGSTMVRLGTAVFGPRT